MLLFTSEEKAAIVHLALSMASIDGNADDKEQILCAVGFAHLDIDEQEIDLAGELSSHQATSVISNMTKEEKIFVCSFLAMLIAIDKKVHPNELKLWKLLSSLCDFPISLPEAITIATRNFADYV